MLGLGLWNSRFRTRARSILGLGSGILGLEYHRARSTIGRGLGLPYGEG